MKKDTKINFENKINDFKKILPYEPYRYFPSSSVATALYGTYVGPMR